MRFSAIFQLPLPPQLAAAGPAVPEEDAVAATLAVATVPVAAPVPEVPPADDLELDQRVRLIGEWQLGEGG